MFMSDKNLTLGDGKSQPLYLKEDLKFMKEWMKDKEVLVGRKTFELHPVLNRKGTHVLTNSLYNPKVGAPDNKAYYFNEKGTLNNLRL